MPGERMVRWSTWDGSGTQTLSLRYENEEWTADGHVDVPGVAPDLQFAVRLDERWHAREFLVFRGGSEPELWLRSDGAGRWIDQRAESATRPEFDGCIDVDLVCTPFTNTLPIRRLALPVGESAELAVIWFDPDERVLLRDPQRYTRLAERRWRFDSLDSAFTAELEVDADGLVLDYPELFRRLP